MVEQCKGGVAPATATAASAASTNKKKLFDFIRYDVCEEIRILQDTFLRFIALNYIKKLLKQYERKLFTSLRQHI